MVHMSYGDWGLTIHLKEAIRRNPRRKLPSGLNFKQSWMWQGPYKSIRFTLVIMTVYFTVHFPNSPTIFIIIIFSLICKDLIDTGVLFNGISSELFDRVGKIPRNFLSQIINAGKEGLNHVQDVLINLEIAAMYADAEAVVKIAEGRIWTCMSHIYNSLVIFFC